MAARLSRINLRRNAAGLAAQRYKKWLIGKDNLSCTNINSTIHPTSCASRKRLLINLLLGSVTGGCCAHYLLGKLPQDESMIFTIRVPSSPQDEIIKLFQGALLERVSAPTLMSVTSSGEVASATNVFFSYPEFSPKNEDASDKVESHGDQNVKGDYLTRHTIADAVAKVAPAVVNITVTSGARGMLLGQSSGSGFIIDSGGTILTNAHVLADIGSGSFRGKITVSMQDGRSFDGELLNYDTAADIAIVKIHSKTSLATVKLGSSNKLRSGEWVIALGSPLHLQNTVTVGVVSCVERKSSEIGLRGVRADYIQSDVAINQGNSGGPLLNIDGEVVGINTMKAFAADGVSFAIPIDSAVKVVEQLLKHGRVVRPWLGMKMLELSPPVLSQIKERDPAFPDVSGGILVAQVLPGSPAERAGIRPGDVIVEFDGKKVSNIHQIVEALGDTVGRPFKVLVKGGYGREVTLSVISEEASPSFF